MVGKKRVSLVVCTILVLSCFVQSVRSQDRFWVSAYSEFDRQGKLRLGLEVYNTAAVPFTARFSYDSSGYPHNPFHWNGQGEVSGGVTGEWLGLRGGFIEYSGQFTVCHDPARGGCEPGYEWIEVVLEPQQEGVYTFTLQLEADGILYEPEPLVVEISGDPNTVSVVAVCHSGHLMNGHWLDAHIAMTVTGQIEIPLGGCWTEIVDMETAQKVIFMYNGDTSVYNGALLEGYASPINSIGQTMPLRPNHLYRVVVYPDNGENSPNQGVILAMTEVTTPNCLSYRAYLPVTIKH